MQVKLEACENCDYFAKWDDKFCKNCRDLEQKGEI